MTLGRRRREHQDTFWVPADRLGSGPRNAFYDRLNQLLDEIDFDKKLEEAAEPYYQSTGRKGLAPGAGKPRHAQVLAERLCLLYFAIKLRLCRLRSVLASSKTIWAAAGDQQLGLAA